MAERLKALLDVAEALSGVLDIDALIPVIMTRACELLNAERCSLFLIDHEKKELITRFQGGLNKSIRIPLSRGIVGHAATTGNIVNINDPYSDPRFDQSVDKMTGFRTRNLVCVPIFNNRGEITGVTEMINKIDDGPFIEDDFKMIMAFNVFCGISLDNARLYQASLDLTNQLRTFINMSKALSTTDSPKDIIEEILNSVKSAIHASRATAFLIQDDQLTPFVNVGTPIKYGTIFVDKMKDIMKTTIFDPEEVLEHVSYVESGKTDISTTKLSSAKSRGNSTSMLSIVFDSSSSATESSDSPYGTQESICILPLMSSSNELIGVMELSSFSKILPEDANLISCFAVYSSLSLERSELKEMATLGALEKKIKNWMTQEERTSFDIPEKLKLESTSYLTLNFDAASYDAIGFFKVIFQIFNHFGLLSEFRITNEKFFKFLYEISSTYKDVPYHNWRHAVDVTQYVTYELEKSGIVQKLTKLDILSLLVAAICHDANHDGFSNIYNVKAETPLGILFKNQSVMETHHCAIAISVITKDETNIFSELSAEDYKKTWSLIIKLILNTDMAKHFTFLKEVNPLLDEGKLSIDNPDHKEYYFHLILKCADISNVSRPFELANRWCDVLCEEFFRQGDLEAAHGMEYTSNLNDRAHLDKPKSQIGFYTFVCLPLYKTAARAMPELQVNADQIESNLEIWKKEAEKSS
jgi:putative methionine-R-sulfoxide reductase with GAF domain